MWYKDYLILNIKNDIISLVMSSGTHTHTHTHIQTINQTEYQEYKINVKCTSTEHFSKTKLLTVVGSAPNGVHVNYKSLFHYVVSMCFQTTKSNDTGLLHLTTVLLNGVGGTIKQEFQFLLKDMSKNEHKILYELFKDYMYTEQLLQ